MVQPSQQKPKTTKMGYPLIEKLIETEDFSKVNQSMTSCYDMLERMLKDTSGGLKRQKMIRQALKAYDLTTDLIKELLKTKYEMIKQQQEALKNQSKQKK